MKRIKWCLFCGTKHPRPNNRLCMAKGEVLRMYMGFFSDRRRRVVMDAHKSGLLESDAKRLVKMDLDNERTSSL